MFIEGEKNNTLSESTRQLRRTTYSKYGLKINFERGAS